MRYLCFLLLFQFCSYEVFSQLRSPAVEIFMGTENVSPSSKDIEFYLTAIGAVWGGERVSPTENNYYLTNEFDNSVYLVPINNNSQNSWGGWDFVLSRTGNPIYPIYGWGLYKISTDESNSFFYIDFRDDRLGNYSQYSPPSYGHDIDIWIKYDDLNNEFYLRSKRDFAWGNSISTVQTLTIWSIKQKGSPSTQQFPLFLIVTNQNGHPHLTWNPYHLMTTGSFYRVERSINENQFSVIYNTPSASIRSFTDEDITYAIGSTLKVRYRIKAVNNSLESLSSNIVELLLDQSAQKRNYSTSTDNKYLFLLEQNYPNPFNPKTSISYFIKEKGFVSLKIFDLLGKEIATLVEEVKTAGEYSVNFDAGNLPSGVYIYSIKVNDFVQNMKMTLLK